MGAFHPDLSGTDSGKQRKALQSLPAPVDFNDHRHAVCRLS